jgi:hypothetical protein
MPKTEVIAMTNVTPLPLHRPRPAARPTGRPGILPVSVEWDEGRDLYVVICDRCCEAATMYRLEDADGWAETHHCDPELAALLATVLDQVAA